MRCTSAIPDPISQWSVNVDGWSSDLPRISHLIEWAEYHRVRDTTSTLPKRQLSDLARCTLLQQTPRNNRVIATQCQLEGTFAALNLGLAKSV